MAGTNFKVKNGLEIQSGTVIAGGGAGTSGQVLSSTGTGVQWVNAATGTGDVVGPASATDNAVVRFDGTTGKLIQNSTVTLSDTGILTVPELSTTSITSTGNNPIVIAPDGTGDVHLNADSVRIGDNNADATIATRGTGDLLLTTHEGSATEGVIRLYDGANGNITLTPNGTGQVQVGSDQVVTLIASQTLTNKTLSSNSVWNGNVIGSAYGGAGTVNGILKANGSGTVSAASAGTDYVTSVSVTSPVSNTGTTANPTIALASGYGDTQNPYGSKTANYFLASPNGSAGVPTWRSIVAADIPTLNQNTTGNAATASALQTARNINGVSFNGTADITVTAAANTLTGTTLASGVTASSLTSVGTLTGLTVTRTTSGDTGTFTNTSTTNQSANVNAVSDNSTAISLRVFGSAAGSYGMLAANSTALYTTATSLNLCADNASGVIKFSTGSSVPERMRLDASGNLGIGKTPSYKLDVNGTINGTTFYSNGYTLAQQSSSYIQLFRQDGGIGIFLGGADPANYYDNTTHIFRDRSSGEYARLNSTGLGIGTSSPASKLMISGTGTGAWFTVNRTDSGTNIIDFTASGSRLGYVGYNGSDLYLNQASAANTIFFTNSTERMRITSGGDVLVNATATADSSKLYVAGNLGTNGSQFNFRPGSGTQYELVNRVGAGFDFYVNNAGTLAARLDSSGNLGIGTSSPGYKLTVAGTSGSAVVSLLETGVRSWGIRAGGLATNTFDIADFTAGASRLSIDSSGNVGIGTSSPTQKIMLGGQTGATSTPLALQFSADWSNGYVAEKCKIYLYNGGGTGLWGFAIGPDNDIQYHSGGAGNTNGQHKWYTGNTETMRLNASGNLGIGTSSPASKLNVSGGNVTVSAGYGIAWSGDQNRIMTPEDNVSGALIRYGSGGICRFLNGSTEHFRVDSSGNVKALGVLLGNNGTKGYGAITTTTSTSTPTGGASGDFTLIY